MLKIDWFKLLKCEYLFLFLNFHDNKLESVRKTSQLKTIFHSWRMKSIQKYFKGMICSVFLKKLDSYKKCPSQSSFMIHYKCVAVYLTALCLYCCVEDISVNL